MAFKLGNNFISIDRPYTTEAGVRYPNLRDPAIRAALGVEEVADPESYDQRFYWSVGNPKLLDDREESDENGNPLYVQTYNPLTEMMENTSERLVTKGLKSNWVFQVKQTAGSLLAQSDWMIIRKAERSIDVPADTVAYRAAVIAEADRLEAAIKACVNVKELIKVVLNQTWPKAD